MRIQVFGDRIWVRKDPSKPTTEGGILIPESAERTPRFSPTVFATVLAVGPWCKYLHAGQRIAIKNVAGDDWYIDDEKLTTLRERDIVGIL